MTPRGPDQGLVNLNHHSVGGKAAKCDVLWLGVMLNGIQRLEIVLGFGLRLDGGGSHTPAPSRRPI